MRDERFGEPFGEVDTTTVVSSTIPLAVDAGAAGDRGTLLLFVASPCDSEVLGDGDAVLPRDARGLGVDGSEDKEEFVVSDDEGVVDVATPPCVSCVVARVQAAPFLAVRPLTTVTLRFSAATSSVALRGALR